MWSTFCVGCLVVVSLAASHIRWTLGALAESQGFRALAVERMASGSVVDVFVVGSSHVYCGIDPDSFECQVLNLAESGLNYQVAEALIDRHWKHVASAKAIIFEFDAVPLYKDTIAFRQGDLSDLWQWDIEPKSLGLTGWELQCAWLQKELAIFRYQPLVLVIGRLISTSSADRPGFRPSSRRLTNATAEEKRQFFNSLGASFDKECVALNKDAFVRLKHRLEESGVRFFILRPPFHKDYWAHPTGVQRELIADDFLSDLQLPADQILDFRKLNELSDEQFSDWTHVSADGASTLSHLINNVLSNPSLNLKFAAEHK